MIKNIYEHIVILLLDYEFLCSHQILRLYSKPITMCLLYTFLFWRKSESTEKIKSLRFWSKTDPPKKHMYSVPLYYDLQPRATYSILNYFVISISFPNNASCDTFPRKCYFISDTICRNSNNNNNHI